MKNWINRFNEMWKNEKPAFFLICFRVLTTLLFVIGTLFGFFVVVAGTDRNPVPTSTFPGAGVFILVLLVLMVVDVFLSVNGEQKLNPKMHLVSAITATALFLWGMILFFTTISEAENYVNMQVVIGFGLIFELILTGLIWVNAFLPKMEMQIISRLIPAQKEQPKPEENPIP
jgi:uncharacterized BrkB/YihY/UPF0761 family membrane protein